MTKLEHLQVRSEKAALAEAERLADLYHDVKPQPYNVPIERFVGMNVRKRSTPEEREARLKELGIIPENVRVELLRLMEEARRETDWDAYQKRMAEKLRNSVRPSQPNHQTKRPPRRAGVARKVFFFLVGLLLPAAPAGLGVMWSLLASEPVVAETPEAIQAGLFFAGLIALIALGVLHWRSSTRASK